MNCVSCDICVYHLGLFVFFPRIVLSSIQSDWSLCPVTTDLIVRVNVRTTTNNKHVRSVSRNRLLYVNVFHGRRVAGRGALTVDEESFCDTVTVDKPSIRAHDLLYYS